MLKGVDRIRCLLKTANPIRRLFAEQLRLQNSLKKVQKTSLSFLVPECLIGLLLWRG